MRAYTVNDEYINVLDKIEQLLFTYSNDNALIGGDFNTSFQRNNAQSKCLSEFIKRNKLQLNWDIKNTKQDNTYVNYNLDQFSCIDHFLISQYLFDLSIDSCTIHELKNISNHVPLVVNFLLNVDYLKMAPKVSQVTGRIAWQSGFQSHCKLPGQDGLAA